MADPLATPNPTAESDLASARGLARPSILPEALGVPLFRHYLWGLAPLSLGTWMQLVALGYLTLQVTGSAAAVGLVGAADGIPAILLALPAGAVGDRWPRATVLAAASGGMGLASLGLAVVAGAGIASLPVLMIGAVLLGAATAFDTPTRQALVADLVPREHLVGAAALTGTVSSLSRILGPSVAGLLLGSAGASVCFAAMAVLVIPYLVVLARNRWPRQAPSDSTQGRIEQLLAGLRWALGDPRARACLVAGAVLGMLGVGYMPFLPVFAREHLHGGGVVLGVMYSVGGVGALAGGLAIGLLSRRAHPWILLLLAAPVYGASLFTLTRVTTLALAVPCLAGISLGFLGANTAMLATLQGQAPPPLRNRVLALYALGYSGGGPLGTLLYAALSAFTSLFTSIAVGAVLVGVALLWCSRRVAGGEVRSAT